MTTKKRFLKETEYKKARDLNSNEVLYAIVLCSKSEKFSDDIKLQRIKTFLNGWTDVYALLN